MENKVSSEQQDSKRKLASVQLIIDVDNNYHIKNDDVAIAKVLGWQVAANRGEVNKNEKVVFFEIDCLLPETTWSEFMRDKKFKVKSRKVRGKLLQGLVLPLNILGDDINEDDYEIGEDLTNILGVTKYHYDADLPIEETKDTIEQDMHKLVISESFTNEQIAESMEEGSTTRKLGKHMKFEAVGKYRFFPSHLIERTDEPRIQSAQEFLNIFKDQPYYATLKYDGTSSTYLINPQDKQFYIFSRNLWRNPNEGGVYKKIALEYKIKEKLLKTGAKYAIQGEIYGPTIGKNLLDVDDIKFAVFTIKDLQEKRYLDMQEIVDVCKMLDLPMVEILEIGDSFNHTLEGLKELSKGNYIGTENPREGLVFRLQQGWWNGYRNSFKIINDDYLLNQKE